MNQNKIFYYNPIDIIEQKTRLSNFTGHIRNREPFVYLRYNDGECRAMLGIREWKGRQQLTNCDGHQYFEEMERPLQEVLFDIRDLKLEEKKNIYVGLHGTNDQERIQSFVVKNNLKDNIHWVSTILAEIGILDLSGIDFFREMFDYPGPRILIGPAKLKQVADVWNSHHIEVPLINCFLYLDEIVASVARLFEEIRSSSPILIMISAGMPAEIIIWKLWKLNKNNMYFDAGSMFDSVLGNQTRGYMRKIENRNIIEKYYMPIFTNKIFPTIDMTDGDVPK